MESDGTSARVTTELTRRRFIESCGFVAAGLATPALTGHAQGVAEVDRIRGLVDRVRDPVVRKGLENAVYKNLLPAATEHGYPGYFNISADGGAYGGDATWPGLDSWQMAGAYLLLGRDRLVADYFNFVRSSQRKDGNIPFAIFPGTTHPDTTYLRGMKYPDDIFGYVPPTREGVPDSAKETRQWVGLFTHWEIRSDPLSTLGPICYFLTAVEIVDAMRSLDWVNQNLASIEAAASWLVTRIAPNGLISGSGFYTELPPRYGYDGVTQCYAVHAFRELARVLRTVAKRVEAAWWSSVADRLAKSFLEAFWRGDHFGEYVHIERGLVDTHGLSDTNFAAIAFGLADEAQCKALWPKLTSDPGFWLGGMPTQTVTKPFSYESWENDPVPFETPGPLNDVAAMGRAWFLDATACRRMGDHERLLESARRVSQAAVNGYWRERYHPQRDGTVKPSGAEKYCEYPAVLARVVLGNPRVFSS
jgi:hypothetical protein